MKKYTYTNTMPYIYDPTHARSHYLIGDAYKNHGEFLESVAKYHRGYEYLVNPTTSYDAGSDIPEMNASVKSPKASLGRVHGKSFDEIIVAYKMNVHSTLWIFMVDMGEEITEYHMNKEEFIDFLYSFGFLDRESGSHLLKIRIKVLSAKMLEYLEERVD